MSLSYPRCLSYRARVSFIEHDTNDQTLDFQEREPENGWSKPFCQHSFLSSTALTPPSSLSTRQKQARRFRCQAAQKIANLTASRTMTVPLPVHNDSEGRPRTLSEFLKLPVGRESMLKGQSCKKRELIGDNTFRLAARPCIPLSHTLWALVALVSLDWGGWG